MVYTYVLISETDNGYYIGICKDLQLRLKKHNKGGVYSTKKRRPFKLAYWEEFEDYKTARNREIELKSYKGGYSLKRLIKI